jgi:3-polyprenyl-4-hydroxybenzoate decarboxylase
MSKEFDQILRELTKQNKDLHNIDVQVSKALVKDIVDIKKSVRNIEAKIVLMEKVLNQLFEVINNLTIFIDDAEDIANSEDLDDEEDWTPYDDRNFSYDDDNDEEDLGGDDYWSSKQDDS